MISNAVIPYEEARMILDKKFSRISETAKPHINKIEREGNLLNDYVVPVAKNSQVKFMNNDSKVRIVIPDAGDFTIHPHAIGQMAEKLGISGAKYLRELADGKNEWQVNLAAKILNEHTAHTDRNKVLVREVGGEVRAFLSDRYKRYSSSELFAQFIHASKNLGLKLYDAYADDLKAYVEMVGTELLEISFDNAPKTYVVFGARLRDSQFGAGMLELKLFMVQVVCLNGMTRDSVLKEIHRGKELPMSINIAKDTLYHDNQAKSRLIRDAINTLMTRDAIQKQIAEIQKSSGVEVDYDKELVKLGKLGLQKSEVEDTKKILMANRITDGIYGEGNTLWKLANAVSKVSQSIKDGDRAREIEDMAGSLFKLAA